MSLKPVQIRPVRKKGRALVNFRKNWQYLLLCAPSVIGYIFFHFVPLAGIIMPFTKYTYRDGIFGSNTETAVKAFQRANSLSADGICGCNTWKKLASAVVGIGRTTTVID